VDYPGLQPGFVTTGPHSYLRLHGVPELFKSSYSPEQLSKIAGSIPEKLESCNIYFNNTAANAAYENASVLSQLLEKDMAM
jgi:uncharacterized protein YecE (DUF72 family)